MFRVLSLLVALIVICASPSAAKRAAFVVGNGAYENTAPLENPVHDAGLIAAVLRSVGFEVTQHTDLTRAAFGQALSTFLAAHQDVDTILFYFAGHGMQLDGENLLLGTDARLQSEFDVLAESIPLSTVATALRRNAKSVLMFIDACRDNPIAANFFAENFPQTRSLETRGLADMVAPSEGTMFFFAASPGQVAYDGIGRNSPFSLALARHLATPGLEILTMTKRVIADVRVLTNDRQNPIVTNDIAEEIYLAGPVVAAPPAPVPLPSLDAQAAEAWEDFRTSTSPDALRAFAETYPDTAYAALALAAADRLRATEDAREHPVPVPVPVPVPEASVPEWCRAPRNEAETAICSDKALLALDARLSEVHGQVLAAVRTGAARGAALIDQRNWRVARDACGTDAACLLQSYQLRLIAVDEFSGATPPKTLVIRAVQEELNRLSCGAGAPDGVVGPRTRAAYALAASFAPRLPQDAPIDTVETLAQLRSVETGLCSYLLRAGRDPDLLTGIWRAVFPTCRSGTSEVALRRLRLSHDGGGVYSGQMAYGDGPFARPIGGRLTGRALSLVHVTPGGSRQVFTFEPGSAPDTFGGFYGAGRCTMEVTR